MFGDFSWFHNTVFTSPGIVQQPRRDIGKSCVIKMRFIVFQGDNLRKEIYHRLGTVEVEDQIAVLT